MISLAFFAPEILGQIAAGTQPTGFTSDWLSTSIAAGMAKAARNPRRAMIGESRWTSFPLGTDERPQRGLFGHNLV